MEETPELAAAFISALRDADAALTDARDRLARARVHDTAFGKLFEAHEVREAYHRRLPDIQLVASRPGSPGPPRCRRAADRSPPPNTSAIRPGWRSSPLGTSRIWPYPTRTST
jgi:hypothetical protein